MRLRPREALEAARTRFAGSFAQSVLRQLKALDFSGQTMMFGGGLLISVLPFLILMSAFASANVDSALSTRLGLDRRSSQIVAHLFANSPAPLNGATITSLVFFAAGTLAVAGSLQQIYEKVFGQAHRGMRDLYRLPVWIVGLSGLVTVESLAGKPVSDLTAETGLVEVFTFAVMTPFSWWTMHFLLAGRVSWRRLMPAAIATGAFFVGLGIFSKLYFSSTIVDDSQTYGAIGAVFAITTWFIAIGAVVILGAVVGAVWHDRRH